MRIDFCLPGLQVNEHVVSGSELGNRVVKGTFRVVQAEEYQIMNCFLSAEGAINESGSDH